MRVALNAFAIGGYCVSQALAATVPGKRIFDQPQKPRTVVSADVYARISKYPAYTNAANLIPLIPDCTPPYGAVLTKYINATFTDTQAGIYVNHADQEVVVGIPGTNSTQDDLTDLTFPLVPYLSPNVTCVGCLVHVGFLNAWNSIATEVASGVTAQLAKYPSYKVVIAGHSLGGALCAFALVSLSGGKYPVKAAYCSGAPRFGNLATARLVDKISGVSDTNEGIYYRVTHNNDGVPELPPQFLGFVHPQGEYWESAYNVTIDTTYRCYGNEPADCINSVPGINGINNAHATYNGVRYNCRGGFSQGPPNPN